MRDKLRPRWAVVWTPGVSAIALDWFDTDEEALAFARGKSVGAVAPAYVMWCDRVYDPVEPPDK